MGLIHRDGAGPDGIWNETWSHFGAIQLCSADSAPIAIGPVDVSRVHRHTTGFIGAGSKSVFGNRPIEICPADDISRCVGPVDVRRVHRHTTCIVNFARRRKPTDKIGVEEGSVEIDSSDAVVVRPIDGRARVPVTGENSDRQQGQHNPDSLHKRMSIASRLPERTSPAVHTEISYSDLRNQNGSVSATSARRGADWSRSESNGSATGHSTPTSGSSQAMPDSVAGS